jgi:hypothetical protein
MRHKGTVTPSEGRRPDVEESPREALRTAGAAMKSVTVRDTRRHG